MEINNKTITFKCVAVRAFTVYLYYNIVYCDADGLPMCRLFCWKSHERILYVYNNIK